MGEAYLVSHHLAFWEKTPLTPLRCPRQLPPDSNQPRLLSSECTQVPFNEPRYPCRDRQENKSLPCGSWGHLMRSGGQKGAQSPASHLRSQPSLPAAGVQDFLLSALPCREAGRRWSSVSLWSSADRRGGMGLGEGWAAAEAPRAGQLVEGWGRPQRVFFLPPPLGTPSPS